MFPLKNRIDPRGQSLLEFAIVLPLFLILLAGIADLGLMYLTSQTIQHASREGARFAVKLENLEVANPGDPGDFRVSDYVETYIPDAGLYSGFTDISTVFLGCATSDQVTVIVSGDYSFLALNMIGLDSVQLNLTTTMRYELCEGG